MKTLSQKMCVACLSVFASSAVAQSLPPGTYSIEAFTDSICPFGEDVQFVGTLNYPGPGKLGTELHLLEEDGGIFYASLYQYEKFPAVPAIGLNGWTDSAPASPTLVKFTYGKPTVQPPQQISFHLVRVAHSVAQGKMTLLTSNCHDVIQVNLLRTGQVER